MKRYAFTSILLLLVFFKAYSLQQSVDDIFNEAENRYKSKDYSFALKLYNEIILEYPLSRFVPDAAYRKAVIAVRTGNLDEAEDDFKVVETRYRTSRYFLYIPFWKGIISYRKEEYSKAILFFETFINSGVENFSDDALVFKARSEYALSRTSEAAKTLFLLESKGYDFYSNPQVLSFFLIVIEQEGMYNKVFAMADIAMTKDLDSATLSRIELSVGESYYKLGNYEKARLYYQKILASDAQTASVGFIRLFTMNKENVEKQKEILAKAQIVLSGFPGLINNFYLHIGIESFKQGNYSVANSYLHRLWNPSDIQGMSYLVPLYLSYISVEKNNFTEAEKFLEVFNNNTKVKEEVIIYTLGNFYILDGKWEKAEKVISDFVNYYPKSGLLSRALWMYGYSLYKQGKFQSSLAVIDSALKQGESGELTDSFFRLKSKIFISTGRRKEALAILDQYIPLHPDNIDARLDSIVLSFQLKDYQSVVQMYKELKSVSEKSVSENSGKVLLLGEYITGIALLGEGKSDEGIRLLESIDRKYLLENELSSVYPYIAYYLGWAYYKQGLYSDARRWFETLTDDYRNSVLYLDSLYMAGWCSYLQKDYTAAGGYFSLYSRNAPSYDKEKGSFYYGKSLLQGGDIEKAELVFQSIYTSYPDSSYAPDALFQHAQILEQGGKSSEAINLYLKLAGQYATDNLSREGLYRIGEIYYKNGDYEKARKAFYTFRSRFPKGEMVDDSLYWGGMSALKLGEKYGALLLWEKLVNNYEDSTYRSEVLRGIASIYSGEGEYAKALEYYSKFIISYPDDSSVPGINREIKKLKLLKSGLGDRESSLILTMEEKGLGSQEGREAVIELAALYLYNDETRWDKAYNLLGKVAAMASSDPGTAARAQYYIGEYYTKKYDWKEAVKAFSLAASIHPADKDLAAMAIFRAAGAALYGGDRVTARKMVNLLELKFPSSQWLNEARKLLEGGR